MPHRIDAAGVNPKRLPSDSTAALEDDACSRSRRVKVRALKNVEPDDPLLRLSERTVTDQHLAMADAQKVRDATMMMSAR